MKRGLHFRRGFVPFIIPVKSEAETSTTGSWPVGPFSIEEICIMYWRAKSYTVDSLLLASSGLAVDVTFPTEEGSDTFTESTPGGWSIALNSADRIHAVTDDPGPPPVPMSDPSLLVCRKPVMGTTPWTNPFEEIEYFSYFEDQKEVVTDRNLNWELDHTMGWPPEEGMGYGLSRGTTVNLWPFGGQTVVGGYAVVRREGTSNYYLTSGILHHFAEKSGTRYPGVFIQNHLGVDRDEILEGTIQVIERTLGEVGTMTIKFPHRDATFPLFGQLYATISAYPTFSISNLTGAVTDAELTLNFKYFDYGGIYDEDTGVKV